MITVSMAYYDQPLMMMKWWESIREMPSSILDQISFIFVDDASPNHPLSIPDSVKRVARCKHYRVVEDIPWHQPGARNLAMKMSSSEWNLLLDPDHVLTPSAARDLLALRGGWERGVFYTLQREYVVGRRPLPIAPNMFVIHREDFWASGGYDERFAGHKGHSDIWLKHILMNGVGLSSATLAVTLECWSCWDNNRETEPPPIPDAAVLTLPRDPEGRNKQFRGELMDEWRGRWSDYCSWAQGRACRFKWEEIP